MAVPPNMKRNPITPVRISSDDKKAFMEAAKIDGCKSLGTWLKRLARKRIIEISEAALNDAPIENPKPNHQ